MGLAQIKTINIGKIIQGAVLIASLQGAAVFADALFTITEDSANRLAGKFDTMYFDSPDCATSFEYVECDFVDDLNFPMPDPDPVFPEVCEDCLFIGFREDNGSFVAFGTGTVGDPDDPFREYELDGNPGPIECGPQAECRGYYENTPGKIGVNWRYYDFELNEIDDNLSFTGKFEFKTVSATSPATLGLIAFGLAGLGVSRRRRTR